VVQKFGLNKPRIELSQKPFVDRLFHFEIRSTPPHSVRSILTKIMSVLATGKVLLRTAKFGMKKPVSFK
jgi:hypothetical protein